MHNARRGNMNCSPERTARHGQSPVRLIYFAGFPTEAANRIFEGEFYNAKTEIHSRDLGSAADEAECSGLPQP